MGLGEVAATVSIVNGGLEIIRQCVEIKKRAEAKKREEEFWEQVDVIGSWLLLGVIVGGTVYFGNIEQRQRTCSAAAPAHHVPLLPPAEPRIGFEKPILSV